MATTIPRLPYNYPIVINQGYPAKPYQQWWDSVAVNVETQITGLEDAIADIEQLQSDMQDRIDEITLLQTQMQDTIDDLAATQADLAAAVADIVAAQAAADAAQSTANTAQSTANTANTTANTVKRDDSISASWTSPGSILSAADVGSDCTITIVNHTRKYGDTSSVSVTGGTITGLAFSTIYYIYYDQTSKAGGSVTYQATTNPNTAQPNAAAGRHFCGIITTPADGDGDTSGGYTPPGGYTGPGEVP